MGNKYYGLVEINKRHEQNNRIYRDTDLLLWRYDNDIIEVSKVSDIGIEVSKVRDIGIEGYRRGISKELEGLGYKKASLCTLIKNVAEKNNINIDEKYFITYDYMVIRRLAQYYNSRNYKLHVNEIILMIEKGNIFKLKKLYRTNIKYITKIYRPKRHGNYIHLDLSLVSNVSKQEVVNWYNKNKREIYNLIASHFDSYETLGSEILKHYNIANVTITNDSLLHYTFELKEQYLKV